MKIWNRIVSIILIILTIIGTVPIAYQAEETTEKSYTTSVETENVSLQGSNDFGNMLANAMNDENFSTGNEEDAFYSIVDVTISENVATVEYEVMETANLVVAIYSEDGIKMLLSGHAKVGPEARVAIVELQGEMPEYFIVRAFLLDTYDFSPLCSAYETSIYTKELQDLLNSTIHDYDEELVWNLDEDETTNFAVYQEDVIVIDWVKDVNVVASINKESKTYRIENANDQIKSLRAGDILVYHYETENAIITKVGSITVDGNVVEIVGLETDIREVFSHVKIEAQNDVNKNETTYGNSQGTVGRKHKVDGEWSEPYEKTFDLGGLAFEAGNLSTSLSGEITIGFQVYFDCYVTNSCQLVDLRVKPFVDLEISFADTIEGTIKIGEVPIPIMSVPSLKVVIEFNVPIELECETTIIIHLETTVGFVYDNGRARFKFEPIEVNTNVGDKVSLFIGAEIAPKVEFAGEVVAVGFSGVAGSRYLVEDNTSDDDMDGPERHDCEQCVSYKENFELSLSIELSFLELDALSYSKTLIEKTWCVEEGYISATLNQAGEGACPNVSYRQTFYVTDMEEVPLRDVSVKDTNGNEWGKTNEIGVFSVYLKAKTDHPVVFTDGETTIERTIRVRRTSRKYEIILDENAPEEDESNVMTGMFDLDSYEDSGLVEHSTDENITWTFYGNGLLIIEGEGDMPDYMQFFATAPWNKYSELITDVEISEGITRIGDFAFYCCEKIESIEISDGVTSIGMYAMYHCESLYAVELPETVQQIGESAFEGCKMLQEINIPYGITVIEKRLLINCESLQSVVLPESIIKIDEGAFWDCKNLETISIPSGVTIIEAWTFADCESLQAIVIPDTVVTIDDCAFFDCDNLRDIQFSKNLTYIGDYAFQNCDSLYSVRIPKSVLELDDGAFYGCNNLAKLYFEGDLPELGYGAIYWLDATVYYPAGNANWEAYAADFPEIMDLVFVPYTYSEQNEESTGTSVSTSLSSMNDITLRALRPGDVETKVESNDSDEMYFIKTATFKDLVPGQEYVMLAVVDMKAEDILSDENLLYITQATAAEDGTMVIRYVQKKVSETSYVIACGPSNKSLENATITFPEMTADGNAQVVDPTVVYDGVTLVEGADYVIMGQVDYSEAGEYKCYIRGIREYTGLVECKYTVNQENSSGDDSSNNNSSSGNQDSDSVTQGNPTNQQNGWIWIVVGGVGLAIIIGGCVYWFGVRKNKKM